MSTSSPATDLSSTSQWTWNALTVAAPELQQIEDRVRHETPESLHPCRFVPHVFRLYAEIARAVEHMGQEAVTAAVVHVFENYYHRLIEIRTERQTSQATRMDLPALDVE